MIILHGTWRPGANQFVIWGEDLLANMPSRGGGRRGEFSDHPFAANSAVLSRAVARLNIKPPGQIYPSTVMLPGVGKIPYPSPRAQAAGVRPPLGKPELLNWKVDALRYSVQDTLQLLAAIHRADAILDSDILFWEAAAQLVLRCIAQERFLPSLYRPERYGPMVAFWQLYPDTAETDRLIQAMPAVCCAFTDISFETYAPQELFYEFLYNTGDSFIRSQVKPQNRGGHPWTLALTTNRSEFYGNNRQLEAIFTVWQRWQQQIQTEQRFRLCIRLDEPGEYWSLNYLLQPEGEATSLISAESLWDVNSEVSLLLKDRRKSLLEELLIGLNKAAARFEPVARSLQTRHPTGAVLSLEEAYRFLTKAAMQLERDGVRVLVPDWWAQRAAKLRARASLRQTGDTPLGFLGQDTLFRYQWQLAVGDTVLSREEFEKLVALKQPLVQINGRWVELDARQIEAAEAFFKEQNEGGTVNLLGALRLSADQPRQKDTLLEVDAPSIEPQLEKLFKKLRSPNRTKSLPAPKGLEATLRPYQERGVAWLAQMRQMGLGACLADDMGLGKTLENIALWLHERSKLKVRGTALVVCPSSVVGNWHYEIERFAPKLKVYTHHGPDRAQGDTFKKLAAQHDVVITSYTLMQRDVDTFKTIRWASVTLDEAQNIKNPATKMAQAARALTADHRVALTGTPIENRLSELWSIFQFLNPGYLGSRQAFTSRFATPIEKRGDKIAAQTLRQIVAPFILRRLKTDPNVIRDLPEKLEYKVFCSLTVEQASLYEACVRAELDNIVQATSLMERRGAILRMLIRLKQVCDHPLLFTHQGEMAGRSGKLARLIEMLEEVRENGERALVFTQYARMGALLQNYLTEQFNEEVLYLHGGTPVQDRQGMVERFQQGDGPPIFVLSLKAGGTGLNLTRATHVFHYDRWYNPAVENQATDRAFRIGQLQRVQVHKFICLGTLEERIDALIEHKKGLAEQVIGGGESWLSELNDSQLRDLVMLRRVAVED